MKMLASRKSSEMMIKQGESNLNIKGAKVGKFLVSNMDNLTQSIRTCCSPAQSEQIFLENHQRKIWSCTVGCNDSIKNTLKRLLTCPEKLDLLSTFLKPTKYYLTKSPTLYPDVGHSSNGETDLSDSISCKPLDHFITPSVSSSSMNEQKGQRESPKPLSKSIYKTKFSLTPQKRLPARFCFCLRQRDPCQLQAFLSVFTTGNSIWPGTVNLFNSMLTKVKEYFAQQQLFPLDYVSEAPKHAESARRTPTPTQMSGSEHEGSQTSMVTHSKHSNDNPEESVHVREVEDLRGRSIDLFHRGLHVGGC
ncbi:unnamed protein product [Coregonus sp. 'balchen']|nr:unnamed protein product [Coregonus sp. 'balchen']